VAILEVVALMIGVHAMAVVLDKYLALKAACVARQAERSVAFGLRSEHEWALLHDYYREHRIRCVLDTTESLEGLISIRNQTISRESVFRHGLIVAMAYPVTRLLNAFRSQWRFPAREIQFLTRVLHCFVAAVQKVEKPEAQHLVELRMNLLTCHELIGHRLAGVPEFDKAMNVEHFCQADHVRSATIEEICGRAVLISA
jgi:hypothetical protein